MVHQFYVEQYGDLPIEAIVRAQSVKRWHMIDTTRIQSIAEHSANVATLAYYISISSPQGYFGSPADAALCGLLHDISEAFTGDIPSHTKRELQGVDSLEDRLTPVVLTQKPNNDLALLIKLCDLADGIRFISAHGTDSTAKWAHDGLQEQLNMKMELAQKSWPEHVYDHVIAKIAKYAFAT